jgi:hypothetical protein
MHGTNTQAMAMIATMALQRRSAEMHPVQETAAGTETP